ncbi:MAG: DUF2894 domain-containing protein [Betaproteobacteria bacterium]|nr:DUF2894 domain-containing protein [Betaproteobacteria bacterium]
MAEILTNDGTEPGKQLTVLRERGMDRLTPVRLVYLDALARRAAKQPETIRRLLTARIAQEADALSARYAQPVAKKAEPAEVDPPSLLAELLAYIGEQVLAAPTLTHSAASAGAAKQPSPEINPSRTSDLKSVSYFHTTWSKLSTEQQLAQTLAQAPENAGPMNSQHLVLRALTAMRDHAPEYLLGFMSYIDTLIWLERASPVRASTDRSPLEEREKPAKNKKRS